LQYQRAVQHVISRQYNVCISRVLAVQYCQ
jgi:hypothetical protein